MAFLPGRRSLISAAVAVTVLSSLSVSVSAQTTFPDRPIRMVVPTGAGGITDVLARILAQSLSGVLKQPVVVENKPGGSGIIGSSLVAQAQPDGYTMLFAFPTHVANPSTIKSIPYDTVQAFAPVAQVGQVLEILLVNQKSPINSVEDLIKDAKGSPGKLNYGSVGAGSQGDVCTLVFQSQAGINMVPVPYKSEPEMLTALIRDDIQVAFASAPASLPMLRGGQVKALAVSSSKRLPLLPDVPTVAEAGLKGYDVTGWNGLFVPKGTPRPIIDTLNAAVNKALEDPKVREQFRSLGVPILGGSPEQLQQAVVRDIALVADTLRAIGYKPQ